MLTLENVGASFGNVPVLRQISMEVRQGELVTLIGANGAGKTTTLRTISGLLHPSVGRISFEGRDLTLARASAIVRAGVAHSPEGRGIFPMMTVIENLLVGGHTRRADEVESGAETVFGHFPRLRERQRQLAGSLSGGEQQMLAIGRALMSRPKLLLLDEPSLGLAPIIVAQVAEIVRTLHGSGMTILLVEQNARLALALADRAYVLESGRIVLEGAGSDLLKDPHVMDAYLGGGRRAPNNGSARA